MQENFEQKHDLVIEETELKQVVYVFNCSNSTLQIKGKINSIILGELPESWLKVLLWWFNASVLIFYSTCIDSLQTTVRSWVWFLRTQLGSWRSSTPSQFIYRWEKTLSCWLQNFGVWYNIFFCYPVVKHHLKEFKFVVFYILQYLLAPGCLASPPFPYRTSSVILQYFVPIECKHWQLIIRIFWRSL